MPARFLVLCWCVLLGLSVPTLGHSATYWVSTSGDDGNGCVNSSTPLTGTAKLTIGGAIANCNLQPGDTLRVRGGTYSETVFMITGPSGTSWSAGSFITIEATPGEQVVWSVPSGQVQAIRIENVHHVVFSGFIFDGTTGSNGLTSQYTSLPVSGSENLFIMGCNDGSTVLCAYDIRLQNSELRNTAYGAAQPCQYCGRFEFLNNYVHDIGKVENCAALYLLAPDALIDGNTFERIPCGTVNFWNQDSNTTHNGVVRNNIFRDIGLFSASINGNRECCHPINNNCPGGINCAARIPQGSLNVRGGSIQLARGNNGQVYNNVISNSVGGIYVGFGVDNALVTNNTIYGNTSPNGGFGELSAGIYFDDQCSNSVAYNNISYSPSITVPPPLANSGTNNTFANNLCSGGSAGAIGCTQGNPNFANTAIADFHLRNPSPAINAGVLLAGVPPTDIEGYSRVGAVDIGAYECQNVAGVDCVSVPPQPTGPVSLLRCDGNFTDSENGFAFVTSGGPLTNGAPLVDGSSCVFDGVNDKVQSPNDAAFRPSNFCLTTWLSASTPPTLFERVMFAETTYELGITPTTGVPYCYINNGPTVTGTASITDGATHLLGCSYDGLVLRLWVDNENISSRTVNEALSYLGTELLSIGGGPDYFHGRLDNIRINADACTPLGMQQIFNERTPALGTSSTHWRFYQANADEGTTIAGQGVDALNIVQARNGKLRLRWNIKRNGSTLTEYFPLECNLNGGTFVQLDNSCDTSPACITTDSIKNMGDATADLDLPNDGFTFTPGRFVVDTINSGLQTTVADGQVTEWEYGLAFRSTLAHDDVLRCRARTASGPLDSYPAILPTITMDAPGLAGGGGVMKGIRSQGGTRR